MNAKTSYPNLPAALPAWRVELMSDATLAYATGWYGYRVTSAKRRDAQDRAARALALVQAERVRRGI